jgi:hypothetical protein
MWYLRWMRRLADTGERFRTDHAPLHGKRTALMDTYIRGLPLDPAAA